MKKLILLFLLCGCASTNYTQTSGISYPEYLKTADSFVGLDERRDRLKLREFMRLDPVQYEWCAAFVNAVLRVNSVPGSGTVAENPLLARSFLEWGVPVDEPRMGDIVVFPRGNEGWQGHVGIYIRTVQEDGITYYMILGGNQNDKVSYKLYPASSALGIRRWNTDSSGSSAKSLP